MRDPLTWRLLAVDFVAPGCGMEMEWERQRQHRVKCLRRLRHHVENTGVLSYGRASDSSYGVSGISSAGTVKDNPKIKTRASTRTERNLLIRAPEFAGILRGNFTLVLLGRGKISDSYGFRHDWTSGETGSSTARQLLLNRDYACAVKGAGLQRVQLPPGNWFAPPGSNRNGGGGNEAVGASGVEGRLGDLASVQAVT